MQNPKLSRYTIRIAERTCIWTILQRNGKEDMCKKYEQNKY